jgi:peroxiredoxin
MLQPASDTLSVGDAAPEFSLPAFDRTVVSLSDFKGKPTVVVFIRGTW